MAETADELEAQALKLAAPERARLAQRLIASLDEQADPEVERLWFEEAERRLAELRSGKVVGIPIEVVMKKARVALR